MNSKTWKALLGMMVVAAMTFTFVACGDDKDDASQQTTNGGNGGGETSLSALLVGNTWYEVYESTSKIEVEGMTFKADGTATGYELKRRSSDNFTKTESDVFNVHYSLSGDILTVIDEDGDINEFKITANQDGTITRQSVKDDGSLGSAHVYKRVEYGKTLYDVMAELVAKRQQSTSDLASLVVGNTWYVVYESTDLIEVEAMSFNAGGTATGYELKCRSNDNFTQIYGEQFTVGYSLSGNILTVMEEDGDADSYRLTANQDGTITRQRIKDDGSLGTAYTYKRLESGKTLYDVMSELAAAKRQKK